MDNESGAVEIPIGVSACLLGQAVRYNGGHSRDKFVLEHVAPFAELVPVCPEVEIGLGTPRETLQLRRSDGLVQLVAPKSGADHTIKMSDYAAGKVEALKKLRLRGFILKKDSPSCGMQRVRVYDQNGSPTRNGSGVFAEALMRDWPTLPVEEEGRLKDHKLRENFFERVFAYDRLERFFGTEWSVGCLVRFHTAEKLLLMSHSPERYRALGRLAARAKQKPRAEVERLYREGMMAALQVPASRKRQTNALEHVAGFFKKQLSSAEKQGFRGIVDDYRRGLIPLAVPLALVKSFAERFGQSYVAAQTYLDPHPKQLMLRSFV